MYKHLHFYLERVGEASEIPARARAGRSVWSKLTAPGQGKLTSLIPDDVSPKCVTRANFEESLKIAYY
jgi:hypothetical protein